MRPHVPFAMASLIAGQEQLRSGNRVSLNFLDKNYSLMATQLNRESGPASVPERAVSSLRAQLNIERIMVDAMNDYQLRSIDP